MTWHVTFKLNTADISNSSPFDRSMVSKAELPRNLRNFYTLFVCKIKVYTSYEKPALPIKNDFIRCYLPIYNANFALRYGPFRLIKNVHSIYKINRNMSPYSSPVVDDKNVILFSASWEDSFFFLPVLFSFFLSPRKNNSLPSFSYISSRNIRL